MKSYSNKKKCLNRLRYLTKFGYYISVRDCGSKSRLRFRTIVEGGSLDIWQRVESYGSENLRVGVTGSIRNCTVAHFGEYEEGTINE